MDSVGREGAEVPSQKEGRIQRKTRARKGKEKLPSLGMQCTFQHMTVIFNKQQRQTPGQQQVGIPRTQPGPWRHCS